MTTRALITMISTMGIVTAVTAYFFIKILRTPPNSDSKKEDKST